MELCSLLEFTMVMMSYLKDEAVLHQRTSGLPLMALNSPVYFKMMPQQGKKYTLLS